LDQFDFVIPEKKKFKLSIYGQTFTMTRPTVSQAEELDSLMRSAKDNEKLLLMRNVFDKLGLPLDFTKEMDMEDFTKLVEFITGAFAQKKS
jgi:hypothetical protein